MLAAALVLFGLATSPALAAGPDAAKTLTIDVPVHLKPSKVVYNMDHPSFAGDQEIGLMYMRLMLKNYNASETPIDIVSVFHGAGGYMLLNDATYNRVRKTTHGNPFKAEIAELQKEGVKFEECGQTARANGWVNADLLPGVKVNTGANLRIVQLVQDGYVQLHP